MCGSVGQLRSCICGMTEIIDKMRVLFLLLDFLVNRIFPSWVQPGKSDLFPEFSVDAFSVSVAWHS